MNRVDHGRMLARGLYQEERIRMFFSDNEDVQSVRKVIRALNTIDEAAKKPAHSASRALLFSLVGVLVIISENILGNASLAPLVVGGMFFLFPFAVYYLRAREAKNHALPRAVNELEDMFRKEPPLVTTLARIQSLELEPDLVARIAPYVPRLSNKGG